MRSSTLSVGLCAFLSSSYASGSAPGTFAVSKKQSQAFSAFATTFSTLGKHRQTRNPDPKSIPSNKLNALVYYPDDGDYNIHEETTFQDNTNNIFGAMTSTPAGTFLAELADKLSHDPDNLSILARLASAFSPPGYDIDIGHINQVRCLTVDNRHLEIEAVVCDESECASLLVPVDFVDECDISNMEDFSGLEACVLSNVVSLNSQGERVMKDREQQQQQQVFAEEEEAQRAYGAIQSVDPSEFTKDMPQWWIHPRVSEEADECDMILSLLNDQDMQDMVQGLALDSLRRMDLEYQWQCENAVVPSAYVRAIGPAGMLLVAETEEGFLMNIPIQFASGPVEVSGDSRTIRGEVLGLVSSVNV